MPNSRVVAGGAARRHTPRPIQLTNAVEGQIAELCRDVAVEAKRMRRLQEQADELRTVIRQWLDQSEPDSDAEPASRAARR